MDFFSKYKRVILRALGGLLLLVGFVAFFWISPEEGVSRGDLATANVARMEASARGEALSSSTHKASSPLMKSYDSHKEKQIKYLFITMMLLGALSLGYSLLNKERED